MRIILINLFFVLNFVGWMHDVYSQEKMTVYVFKHRYNSEGIRFIEQNENLQEIKLLGGYMISPRSDGEIDRESVRKYLERLFENKEDSGMLCVNYEAKYYKDLRDYSKNHKKFLKAEEELIRLFKFIKLYRPNIKIGLYGVPFRTFYPSQDRWNNNQKFDRLLSYTDVIFPSLYVLFKDEEFGKERNDQYFHTNLSTAFQYGTKLNKPIIPFIWYTVNPGNKKYGSEILDPPFFQRYLKFIENYRFKERNKVSGVVWWEPSESAFLKIKSVNSNRYPSSSAILKEFVELINNFEDD